MIDGIWVRAALRARQNPRWQALERIVRGFGPVNRLAKRRYARYKERMLSWSIRDPAITHAMLRDGALPDGYARGMDERLVEYPWVLARIPVGPAWILDAGSTLNFPWVADHPTLAEKTVIVATLAPEGVLGRRSYSYLYGDLRSLLLKDACVDLVVSISTLEHIGMDNRAYTGNDADAERDPYGYRDALREFRRVLRPGGTLLFTVPFGRPQNLGWLHQFDRERLEDALSTFAGSVRKLAFFRHDPRHGWHLTSAENCADADYVREVHPRTRAPIATLATAVACGELVRPNA